MEQNTRIIEQMSNLVKKGQTHHHTITFRKKKDVMCRFNALLAPSDKTRIVYCEEKIVEIIVKQSKNLLKKYFLIMLQQVISLMSHNQKLFEECGVTAEHYDDALACVEKNSLYYIDENHVK